MKKWAIIVLFLASPIFWGVSKADAQMMGHGMMGGGMMGGGMMGQGMMGQGMMGGKEAGERAWLGVFIQNITPELAESLGLKEAEGVLISDVAEGGPAQAAGIEREDVIKGINGRGVKTVEELLSIIREASPGDTVAIDISRRGERGSVEVKLGNLKEAKEGEMMTPEMGGPGMMEQGAPSPQAMGEMAGEMMGQMMGEMMQGMMGGMMRGMGGMMRGMVDGMGGMMGMMGEGFKEDDVRCPGFHSGMWGDYGRHGMEDSFLTRTIIERLKLTDEQIEKVKEIEKGYKKGSIRLHSEIKIAGIDLHDLLRRDDVQMEEIEKKVAEVEAKKTELHLKRIKAFNELKGILTKEQREGLKSLRNY